MERGIEVVRRWAEEAVRPVELLACTPERGKSTLEALNVTERSPLGGIAGRTGGILVDSGWLRILGAGSERLARGLAEWNGLGGRLRLGGALLVGDDAVGGFFALNGGALPGGVGNIFYLAPDTLEWEDLEVRYSGWVKWAFTGAPQAARLEVNQRERSALASVGTARRSSSVSTFFRKRRAKRYASPLQRADR